MSTDKPGRPESAPDSQPGWNTVTEEHRLFQILGYRLAQSLCSGLGAAHRPCGLHLSIGERRVREVMGIAEREGWALRKVHAAPTETMEEILANVEAGLVSH